MNIMVNGKTKNVKSNYTAQQLLSDMGFAGKRVAVELNMEIVPRSNYAQTFIADGDKIEIVRAIGGG
ncbi:Sulfur carrier protein ThiS [hydrothermal vent metagenome]|uniref:Sulfur carrier protein ThiS n=1 Tax=hydrothermal vent metagenome TaxID=652676 RepID=A0A3B1AIZ5_9ZZZZ